MPHVLVQCERCQTIVLACHCPDAHTMQRRMVPVCGACTCTGAVWDAETVTAYLAEQPTEEDHTP